MTTRQDDVQTKTTTSPQPTQENVIPENRSRPVISGVPETRRTLQPVRPALRTKNQKIYYSAHSFDDYAWHRGDSDDSGEEGKQSRSRRRPRKRRATTSRPALESSIPENDEQKLVLQPDLERGDTATAEANEDNASEKKSQHSQKDDDDDGSDDEHLVSWDGAQDKQNPKNWPLRRKWAAVFVVSSFTFISPVSSAIVAPAMGQMGKDLNLQGDIMQAMVMSIFVLAYAIGPLLFGPLSEVQGRVKVLQLSNLFFLVWNLACAFAQTPAQMYVFRFLAGIGGSAPLAIGGAVLGDCFVSEQRGKAISIYSLAPLLGPAIGPVAGGFIAQGTTWRWIFRATSIADALIWLVGYFFLQETYAPVLLKRKAEQLKMKTGDNDYYTKYEDEDKDQSLAQIIRHAMVRPFIMLGTQPIIQAIALYMAYLYGLMYLMLSTYPKLWTVKYQQPINIGSLNYIALGIGYLLGSQICAPINDRIYRRLKHRNNGVGKPEYRIPLMFLGSSLMPIGLFWYGWAAQYKTHWVLPNVGAAMFCAGSIICFQCMQAYIVDSYTRYAASGIAAAVVLRSLAGFGFPLWAPYMFKKLDYGWGNSLLGFVGIALGFPAPLVFWRYGERLRARSQYAAD